jgi:DNA-binding MarR family transcriptional regulator
MINYMPKLVDQTTYSVAGGRRPGRAGRATAEQIAAWQAFARAWTSALRSQEAVLEGSGLDLSEYDVLVTLAEGPPEGMRPTELTERALITKSGMTRLLQRLDERQLIERHACPSDRRGQLIAVSAQGRHLLRRAAPGVLRGLAGLMSGLSTADLASLTRTTERMTEAATPHSTV